MEICRRTFHINPTSLTRNTLLKKKFTNTQRNVSWGRLTLRRTFRVVHIQLYALNSICRQTSVMDVLPSPLKFWSQTWSPPLWTWSPPLCKLEVPHCANLKSPTVNASILIMYWLSTDWWARNKTVYVTINWTELNRTELNMCTSKQFPSKHAQRCLSR